MKISVVSLSLIVIVAISAGLSAESGSFGRDFSPRASSCLSKEQSCCLVKTRNCCCPASQHGSQSQSLIDTTFDPDSAFSIEIGSYLSSIELCSCRSQTPADETTKQTRSESNSRRNSTDRHGSTFEIVVPAPIHSFDSGLSSRIPLLGSLPEPFLRSTHLLI